MEKQKNNKKKKATKKPVKKTAKVVKLENEFNSQYLIELTKSNLIQIKNDNNSITCEEVVKMIGKDKETIKNFIMADSELMELFNLGEASESMIIETIEEEIVTEVAEIPEEKIPTQDIWLIDYFKGRNKEEFMMNTAQVTMIAAIWKKMYNQVLDTACKNQLIGAYINLFNYIVDTYGSEKIKI